MPPGLLLSLAIACEVCATLALRVSHGLTRLAPSIVVVAGYTVSFFLMAQVLKSLPVGVTYAVWSAAGTVLVALAGIVVWHESATVPRLASLALVVVGVVGLNLTSGR